MNKTKMNVEAQRISDEIISKCWSDLHFKENLISNPLETLEEYYGKKILLPEGKRIQVVDQTDQNYEFIVIPRKEVIDDIELSEDELTKISGGLFPIGFYLVGLALGLLVYTAGVSDGSKEDCGCPNN